MTVILTPRPDPHNPKQQSSLEAACAQLEPSETLFVEPGIWTGKGIVNDNCTILGSDSSLCIIKGDLIFKHGGVIDKITLRGSIEVKSGYIYCAEVLTFEPGQTGFFKGGIEVKPR